MKTLNSTSTVCVNQNAWYPNVMKWFVNKLTVEGGGKPETISIVYIKTCFLNYCAQVLFHVKVNL